MRSFLKEIEDKFIELEETTDDELDEQNVTGAIAGYNTPNAFSKDGADDDTVEVLGYKRVKESVNTPPSFRWDKDVEQHPESQEEEMNDKFPFANDDNEWYNKNYKYPSVHMPNKPSKTSVSEIMDTKYEQLIESYRSYATGDAQTSPKQKIQQTIKEVARQLQQIERTVNYASRLKTESNVAKNTYGTSAAGALNKISERLIKISERVRALGE